ncbi:hypothetical protein Nepgr_007442 [Nepenthes gracilis]|uniref:EF-hand domain-containing protein n=1 Tax=Nepenthes gracilis TaxID=150966 RepID=A0AAD3S6U7_NEPGR|nr:hypothetical protein Nepgr_007442 [Nepenthes gracilis]
MGRSRFSLFFLFTLLCLTLLLTTQISTVVATGRTVRDLVSDGVHRRNDQPAASSLLLDTTPLRSFLSSSAESCDETYGFMPCTTTALGNLFLIIVYGCLMYLSATYLSNGGELLLDIWGPGIVGGLFLPILGAFPDAMLVLVSGLSGSTETAQSQVSVGMGLLAGSTVMLLTVLWGTCVIVGKCDIQGSVAIHETDTKGFNLMESGVSTDIWTSYAARIMAFSVIPFVVVQLPQLLNSTSARHIAVLIGLILSIVLLISYCLYQTFQPWIIKRRLRYMKDRRIVTGFLTHLKIRALGRLFTDDGRPNEEVLTRLFHAIDQDNNHYLSDAELRAFVLGMRLDEMKLDGNDLLQKLMKDFDTYQDSRISLDEFKSGISRWLYEVRGSRPKTGLINPNTMKYLTDLHEESTRVHDLLEDEGAEADEGGVEYSKKTVFKAVLLLLGGTIIAAIFADPLVDAVDEFSDATGIPSFFISFIALPLATNSSEAVSGIIFASRKTRRTASLTFSEIYGSATMNNVLCLSVFLALVYIRGLTWDFSSEVLIILIVCIVMGALGSFRTVFPLWTSFIAFVLYPVSLAAVYILDYVFGWS